MTDYRSDYISPPSRLDMSSLPKGVSPCDDTTALTCARYALSLLEDSANGFPLNLIPNKNINRCAVIGSYAVHSRNFLYGDGDSLKLILEEKINKAKSTKFIISVNSSHSYNCFSLDFFNYQQLDSLHEITGAVDFLILIPQEHGLFVMFEDSPACFVAFEDRVNFEKDFVRLELAKSIFSRNKFNWQITTYDKERSWLELIDEKMSAHQE